MSFEAENVDHEVSIEDLLRSILVQLKVLTAILNESTDLNISKDDLNG